MHIDAGLDNNGKVFFSQTSLGFPFTELMAGFEYTLGKMKVMPTVSYLNEIVWRRGYVFKLAGIADDFF
jgi:hypothetical protein